MANEGMGMAGGFAEAAGGVMSGFQFARQQQALEQERKQQELDRAEARADMKLRREQLMKEIQAKDKAREIYSKDPEKDFGIKRSDFLNQDLYEAELSKHFASEFRNAGLGEEAMRHESVGMQFYENGTKKGAKRAVGLALQGKTSEAKSDLEKLGFHVGDLKRIQNKDGSMSFEIIDQVGGKPTVVSTLNAAELAGVYGDEDALLGYLMQKDMQISKTHADMEAKIKAEEEMKRKGLGTYYQPTGGVDPNVAKMQAERLAAATPFVTKDGTKTITGNDLLVTKGLLERNHSLASINEMRKRDGLPEIQLRTDLKKEEVENLNSSLKGLTKEDMSSESEIVQGANWYNNVKPKGEGSGPAVAVEPTGKSVAGGMGQTSEQNLTEDESNLPLGWTTKADYDKDQEEKAKKEQIKKNNESRNWKSRRKPAEKFGMGIDWSKASTDDQIE
jgi:hypothetical protein